MSAPDLNTFNIRVGEYISSLPANATIESVNYDCHTTQLDTGSIHTTASVLMIWSTPIE